tara:strand:- start:641 stop:1585 length:945 start_codon:yes stop_codon:yes gene_type:complete
MVKRKLHEFIDNIEHKQCSCCNEWKVLEQFGKDARAWDGKRSECKSCGNKKSKQRRKVMKEQLQKAREMAPTGFLVCLFAGCTVKGLQPLDQFIGPHVRNDEPTMNCLTCRDKQKEADKKRQAACQKVWDEWRKTHPCVKCMNDPNYEHNYLLIEADHLGGKVTHCSNMSYWSHSERGVPALRAELITVQSLCRFHHALVTQQRDHDKGRILKQESKLRKRAIMNKEKHKRGCCSNPKCNRVLKEGEERAFHFDHRDASTKFMYQGNTMGPSAFVGLSDAFFDKQWPLEKELVDLLCTNCHKVKPGGNRDGYRK